MKLNSHKQIRSEQDKESIHSLPFEYDPTPLKENEGYFYTRGMEMFSINELVQKCHKNSVDHGFWNDFSSTPTILFQLSRFALIGSEVGEAIEAIRHNDFENEKEELADICIRVFDYCGGYGIDLEKAILDKMEKNSKRPYMHGKNS